MERVLTLPSISERCTWRCVASSYAHAPQLMRASQLLLCEGGSQCAALWSNSRQGACETRGSVFTCLPNTQIPSGLHRLSLPRVRTDLQRQIAFAATFIVAGFSNDGIRGSKNALFRSSKCEPDVAVSVPSAATHRTVSDPSASSRVSQAAVTSSTYQSVFSCFDMTEFFSCYEKFLS